MKQIMMMALLSTFAFSGFFADQDVANEVKENERLCKLFTEKVVKYEATMRDDRLAAVTLKSYKERAARFCEAAEPEEKPSK